MRRQRVLAFAAVGASTIALAGCSSTVSGQAQTPHATLTAALFDPCTLPPTALMASGVDPAIDPMGQSPNNLIGWKVCNWSHGNDWGLSVYSSNHTMDQVRNASDYVDQTPANVANRSGVLNHLSGENFQDDCAFTLVFSRVPSR